MLEVLKDQGQLPPNVQKAVRRWDEDVQRLEIETTERQALRSRVAQLRRQSIAGAVFDVVQRLLSEDAAKKARYFDNLRSKLLHNWDDAGTA